jgi:hypothetical protein
MCYPHMNKLRGLLMMNRFSNPLRGFDSLHGLSIAAIFFLVSCATVTSNVYHSSSSMTPPLSSKVLIFPPDAIVNLKNAGGSSEPRADWSEQVQSDLTDALIGYMFENGIEAVPYGSNKLSDNHIDVLRQATVMMDGVELSQRGGGIGSQRLYALSQNQLDKLEQFDADYLLIVALRSDVASGGRQAVAVLGALAGAVVETSSAQFRAAVFDLRDGQLAWANVDAQALSDIGNVVRADDAKWEKAIDHILSEFPL